MKNKWKVHILHFPEMHGTCPHCLQTPDVEILEDEIEEGKTVVLLRDSKRATPNDFIQVMKNGKVFLGGLYIEQSEIRISEAITL